jgi:HEAT repeat protein
MRQLAATACLTLLLFGCDNLVREEASYEGYTTSQWAMLATDQDADVERRREAVAALGELGLSEADKSVPALKEAVADPDAHVRLLALQALQKLAPKAATAQPAVGRAFNDKNKAVVKQALKTYRAIEMAKPSGLNGG